VGESGLKWRKIMYIGEYNHSTDSKGRVIMPANFREELGEKFYITKGMDSCLFIYDEKEWSNLDLKMRNLRLTSKKAREFSRMFYAPARELSFDKQGRILIPQNLRTYAGIDKEVVIIGVSTRIEIWDKERWDLYISREEMNYDEIMDEFEELDI